MTYEWQQDRHREKQSNHILNCHPVDEQAWIEEIIELGTEIDLWDMELPPIPKTKGSKEEFSPFEIEGVLKDLENYAERTIEEKQNEEDIINEYMILKLRLIDGVCIEEVNQKFNIDVLEKFKKQIEKMCGYGLLEISESHIKLTEKGLDLANIVWEEFI